MRRRSPISRVAVAAAVLLAPALAAPATQATAAELADQIVVRHRASATPAERADIRHDAGVSLEARLRLTGVEVVEADGPRAQAIAELQADPDVLWAEPNRPVTAATGDPFWQYQYGLENLGGGGAIADADIDAEAAWTVTRGAGVTVGVVDSGVDSAHPDLAGQLVTGINFVADGQLTAADGNGHGTHVAGTIAAAADNNIGVAGAAPQAKVQALRALNAQGTGSTATVAAAFDYAGDSGLRIVNASLGSPTATYVERQAIVEHPNTLFVVAAGNSSLDVDAGGSTSYPCRYTYANVLCVGASDDADLLASFSNHGTTSVDLLAPGDEIASTYPGNAYYYMSGTSMASPLVAAAAALVAAANPSWTAAQIKAALLGTVDHPAGATGASVTGGRLNAGRAVGVNVGPDGEAPAAPAGLLAVPGAGRVDLTWSPPAAHDLQDYRVWVQDGGAWNPVATVTSPAAAITGLDAGDSLTVRVTARDRTGEESPPSSSITTAALLPGTPAPGQPEVPAAPTEPASTTPTTTGSGTNPAPDLGAGTPSATQPTAPPEQAPSTVTPAITPPAPVVPSYLNQLRVVKAAGRVRALRFQLSAPGRVKVVAVRKAAGRVRGATRTKRLQYPAGTGTFALDKSKGGLRLPAGRWHITVAGETGLRSVVVSVR